MPDENTDVVIGRDKNTLVIIPPGVNVLTHDLTVQNDAVLQLDGEVTISGDMTIVTGWVRQMDGEGTVSGNTMVSRRSTVTFESKS